MRLLQIRAGVVGLTPCCAARTHGFVLSDGNFSNIDAPGAVFTYASGINAAGDTVGAYFDGVSHGYLLNQGVVTTFDVPGATLTNALGGNPSSDIVGSYRDTTGARYGYLLSAGQFSAIDLPSATFTRAAAINPQGDIVGSGIVGGVFHGYLLTRQHQAK